MPFSATCPECDATVKVPDAAAGKKVRCKSCQAVFRAPDPDDEDDRPVRGSRRRTEDDDRPARKGGRKRKKGGNPVLYIVGVVAGLALIGGAIAFVVGSRGDQGDRGNTADAGKTEVLQPGVPGRQPAQEDYGEHVHLRVAQTLDQGDGRLWVTLEFEFQKPTQLPGQYRMVVLQPDGTESVGTIKPTDVTGNKGKWVALLARGAVRTYWVAKVKPGTTAPLHAVSNKVEAGG
jgi:predicted Zn finger-like uncharacterized protein